MKRGMKIGLMQLNPTIGDVWGNMEKNRDGYFQLCERGAEMVVGHELTLLGYPPKDLLSRDRYIDEQIDALNVLRAGLIPGIPLVVNVALPNPHPGKPLRNELIILDRNNDLFNQGKILIPNYDVFDELRYFESNTGWIRIFLFNGIRFCFTVCEDMWNRFSLGGASRLYGRDPIAEIKDLRPDVMINVSGSPYYLDKGDLRFRLVGSIAKDLGCTVIFVSQVGGNDELIFDGRSFAVDSLGNCIASAKPFQEELLLVDTDTSTTVPYPSDTNSMENFEEALVLGIADYHRKTAFADGVVIGLSGGVDSSVVATLAVKALGPERVWGVGMPSPYNAPESLTLARQQAENLGIRFLELPIGDIFGATGTTLSTIMSWNEPGTVPGDVTEENVQARIRGLLLMAISNKFGKLLLSTGNKSELAVGYCTLYGDMNGGLCVIGDVPKELVKAYARWVNRDKEVIPWGIINRPPSAELRPDQKDEDSLPPYPILDRILHEYVDLEKDPEDIIDNYPELDPERVYWTADHVDRAEHKRYQGPVILKVTNKAFGSGRRYPIACKRLPRRQRS